ncbi:MAG: hypothetical protein AB7K24_11675 [Gemmataceae bacterium]
MSRFQFPGAGARRTAGLVALLSWLLAIPCLRGQEWKAEDLVKKSLPLPHVDSPDGRYRVTFKFDADRNPHDNLMVLVDEKGQQLYSFRGSDQRIIGGEASCTTVAFHTPKDQEKNGSPLMAFIIGTNVQKRHDIHVCILDIAKKKVTHTFKAASQIVEPLATPVRVGVIHGMVFAPDGKTLFMLQDGKVGAWDPATGKKKNFALPPNKADLGFVVRIQSLETHLLVACQNGVGLIRFDNLKEWQAETVMPTTLIIVPSPDRKTLAAHIDEAHNQFKADGNRSVVLLDSASLKKIATIELGNNSLLDFMFVPGRSDRILTYIYDGNGVVNVWDATTGKKAGQFTYPKPKVKSYYTTFEIMPTKDGKIATFWAERRFQSGPVTILHGKLWTPPKAE